MNLAREIVALYHGEEEAKKAEVEFKNVFQQGQIPTDIKTLQASKDDFDLPEILVSNGVVKSKSEVRRLATQGGVKINGEKVTNLAEVKVENELIVQIGKKIFVKVELV